MVDAEGNQLGILQVRDALQQAIEAGLDLVEVAPTARPPVCRIMDFGKFKYEIKKKTQQSKKRQHIVQLKEVRLRPKTDDHDVMIKMQRAKAFIEEGCKVQVNMQFRGREIAHSSIGMEILLKFAKDLEDVAKVEREPRLDGKRMVMILTNKKG